VARRLLPDHDGMCAEVGSSRVPAAVVTIGRRRQEVKLE
jgi:hypothetical protein